MDPALIQDKAAFKKRAMAVPVVEKKKEVTSRSSSAPKKKKKSKLKRPKARTVTVGMCRAVTAAVYVSGTGCRGHGQAEAVRVGGASQ